MAPNKSLSEQQYHVIKQALPAYHVRTLTGADNVDKWTTKELWNAFLTGVHIVVGTPAVLADALGHGFVLLSRLSLCVYDECLKTIKNDSSNIIMRDFYHVAKQKGDKVPHILALSASPVINRGAGQNSLQAIESNLDATTITPMQYRNELEAHVHPPRLIKVEYSERGPDHVSATCQALANELASYDLEQDPYVLELQAQHDPKADKALKRIRENGKTYCRDQLRLLYTRTSHINEELGPHCADWYISTCVDGYLESGGNTTSLIADLETKERRHLEVILMRVVSRADSTSVLTAKTCVVSDKAKALLDILSKDQQAGLRTIIFVEQRAMVLALAQVLRCSELLDRHRIGTFVGTSTFTGRATSLVDLFNSRSQAQDLEYFREGSKNLMIATNVLEEGIDIPACNRVICFDLPKNLISFVQRRGRARQPDSQYMLFVARNDLQSDPAKWQALEDKMVEAYLDEDRARSATLSDAIDASGDDHDDTSHFKYTVQSTNALLTLDNARSHLHHFCAIATRHHSRYTDPRPELATEKDPLLKTWTASVTLPPFVHASIRTAESSGPWRGEQAATKNAAFHAYKALHQAGLVNDNLLPAIKVPGPESGKQHAEQPSLVQVAEQWRTWKTKIHRSVQTEAVWHASQVKLSLLGREVLSAVLWLPFHTDADQTTKLYWNAEVCYEVSINPIDRSSMVAEERCKAFDWTSLVLRSVFANNMPAEYSDFAILLSPPDGKVAADFSGSYTGNDFIVCHRANMADPGTVRVVGHHGRAYVLRDICEPVPDSQNSREWSQETQLTVSLFPKRRNFHVPSSNQTSIACTSSESFPLSECMIDRLPIDYSILAVPLPSILHQIDTARAVHRLTATILGPVQITNPRTVFEAISAPAALESAGDYNRLEYLGDSILKFCTEFQLVAQHPTFPEAFLSAAKDNIVCNSNLARASREAGLDQFILTVPFIGKKWRPPYLHELPTKTTATSSETPTREMSSKVLADVVEALIGAAFVDGGLHRAYTSIQALLSKETWWDFDVLFGTILD
jgi:ERCC4-related helicase